MYRVSPFNTKADPVGTLGQEVGQSYFIIRELPVGPGAKHDTAFLVTTSPRSVKGFNLLTNTAKDLFTVAPEDRIVANSNERYSSVEIDEERIYFLTAQGAHHSLSAYNLRERRLSKFPLPAGEFCGPVRVGRKIVVYSQTHLYALEDGEMRPRLEFGSFSAWLGPHSVNDLIPPFGRVPWIVRHDNLYLPGTRDGKAVLMCISTRGPSFNKTLSAQGEGSYTEDDKGRPLVAHGGEIVVYDEASQVTVKSDPQLTAAGQPFHAGPLVLGMARTAGGLESIRFYYHGKPFDYPLAKLKRGGGASFFTDMGFFEVMGTLVFVYLQEQDGDSRVRMNIWDI